MTQRPNQVTDGPDEFDRLAVLTIEGGGVYGLNMLGQLSAVIDHYKIAPLAYAGTSAGAVVAALSWAGYSPKEIRNLFVKLAVDGTGTGVGALSSDGPRSVVDLLGPSDRSHDRFEYADFRRLAGLVKRLAGSIGSALDLGASHADGPKSSYKPIPCLVLRISLVTFTIVVGLFAIWVPRGRSWFCLAAVLLAIISGWALGVWQRLSRLLPLVYSLATALRQIYVAGYIRRGFFSGDLFEEFIDRCLKDSPMFSAHVDSLCQAPLTFGWIDDLMHSGRADGLRELVPLILTATNVTTRELILIRSFDERFHPLSVAKAVRASAGFPVFFRPVDLRCPGLDGWYIDGGMISNFPAWVFSRELRRSLARTGRYPELAIRPWLNIGLRVVPDRSTPASPDERPSEFIVSLFDLARGQVRNELEKALAERLPRAIAIMQPTSQTNAPENLLDIDQLSNDKIRAMFARGEEFAREQLSQRSFSLPAGSEASMINGILGRVISQVHACFPASHRESLKLRANVFVPRKRRLVMAYSYGMDDDTDRELQFNYDSGLTGFCFVTRRPFLCNLRYIRQWAEQRQSPDEVLLGMRRDDHLAVRADRTWLASVPIFDPIDCWFLDPDTPRLEKDPEDLDVWTDFPGTLDGAVFGVLNLDGAIPYGEIDLPEDPESSLTDPRIVSIFNSLQACSMEIGRIFSQAFGGGRLP